MTVSRVKMIGFTSPENFRKLIAEQAVPPRIVKSLLDMVQYLEYHEEQHYYESPAPQRKGHVYRDVRRVKAWLTDWAEDGFDYPAMLPTLGYVRANIGHETKLPTDELRQVLDSQILDRMLDNHLMHRWGEGPDIAAGEGNYDEYLAANQHHGALATHHFVRAGDEAIEVRVETSMSVTTNITSQKAAWPDEGDKHSYVYDGVDLRASNWPWFPRGEVPVTVLGGRSIPTGTRCYICRPISYHPTLAENVEAWSRDYGLHPDLLRWTAETAIRTRHPDAIIEYPSDAANGRQPDVFTLSLGLRDSLRVHYTAEEQAVVIRGYSWKEPEDETASVQGGYYADVEWSRSNDSATLDETGEAF